MEILSNCISEEDGVVCLELDRGELVVGFIDLEKRGDDVFVLRVGEDILERVVGDLFWWYGVPRFVRAQGNVLVYLFGGNGCFIRLVWDFVNFRWVEIRFGCVDVFEYVLVGDY